MRKSTHFGICKQKLYCVIFLASKIILALKRHSQVPGLSDSLQSTMGHTSDVHKNKGQSYDYYKTISKIIYYGLKNNY